MKAQINIQNIDVKSHESCPVAGRCPQCKASNVILQFKRAMISSQCYPGEAQSQILKGAPGGPPTLLSAPMLRDAVSVKRRLCSIMARPSR